MSLSHLKINGVACPLGYEPGPLLLSWHTESAASTQVNACIRVYDSVRSLVWETEGNLNWEGTSLDFKPLPRTRYTVELTVTDDAGAVHTGSTWFETGKIAEPWQAKWIGVEDEPEWALF